MKPIKATITLPEGATVATGLLEREIGNLSGRSNQYGFLTWGDVYPIDSRAIVEWIVSSPSGGQVTLTVKSIKAGTITTTLDLG
jgi:hypothetical protein